MSYASVIDHYLALDANVEYSTYRNYLVENYMTTYFADMQPNAIRVLDLGCGTAWYSQYFDNYTGVDVCAEMISHAVSKHSDCTSTINECHNNTIVINNRRFICNDVVTALQTIVNNNESFDLIIAQAFIHLFDDDTASKILTLMRGLSARVIYVATIESQTNERVYLAKEHTNFYRYKTLHTNDSFMQLLVHTDPSTYNWKIHNEFDSHQNKKFMIAIALNANIYKGCCTQYSTHGYATFPIGMPKHLISKLIAHSKHLRSTAPVYNDYSRYGSSVNTRHIVRVENFSHKMPHVFDYIDNTIKPILCDLIGIPLRLMKEKINYKCPGDNGFPPHQDVSAGWPTGDYITVGIAISDTTIDNGCLWFVNGCNAQVLPHKNGVIDAGICNKLHWKPLVLRSGTTVIFSGLTPHKSNINTTPQTRAMMFVTYTSNANPHIYDTTRESKIARQPPVDNWQELGVNVSICDAFGKFLTYNIGAMSSLDKLDFIVLVGRKNVGKDTCAEYISKKIGWQTYALATPVKQICEIAFNCTTNEVMDRELKELPIPRLQNYTPRMLMQLVYKNMFTDTLAKFMPDLAETFFVHHMENKFDVANASPHLILTDVRSPVYVNYLKSKYNTLVIKITRPVESANNVSENDVDHISNYDYLIKNDTNLVDFYKKIDLIF